MRDGTEYVFDSVNGLMNIDFTHGLIIVAVGTTSCLSVASGQWSLALGQLNVACQFTIVVDLSQKEREREMISQRGSIIDLVQFVLLTCETLRPRVNLMYSGLPKSIQGTHMSPMMTKTFCKPSWLANMNSSQPLKGGVFLNNIMLMNIISTEGAQPGVSGCSSAPA